MNKILIIILLFIGNVSFSQERLPKPFNFGITTSKDHISGTIRHESYNPTYMYILQDGDKVRLYIRFDLKQYLNSPNLTKVYLRYDGKSHEINHNDKEFKQTKKVEVEKTTTLLKDATLHKSAFDVYNNYFRADYEDRRGQVDSLIKYNGFVRLQGENGIKEDFTITKRDSKEMTKLIAMYEYLKTNK